MLKEEDDFKFEEYSDDSKDEDEEDGEMNRLYL